MNLSSALRAGQLRREARRRVGKEAYQAYIKTLPPRTLLLYFVRDSIGGIAHDGQSRAQIRIAQDALAALGIPFSAASKVVWNYNHHDLRMICAIKIDGPYTTNRNLAKAKIPGIHHVAWGVIVE